MRGLSPNNLWLKAEFFLSLLAKLALLLQSHLTADFPSFVAFVHWKISGNIVDN
jgi:hypothetical protein